MRLLLVLALCFVAFLAAESVVAPFATTSLDGVVGVPCHNEFSDTYEYYKRLARGKLPPSGLSYPPPPFVKAENVFSLSTSLKNELDSSSSFNEFFGEYGYGKRLPKGTPIPPSGPSPDRPPVNRFDYEMTLAKGTPIPHSGPSPGNPTMNTFEYERKLPKGTPIPPSGPSPDRPPMNTFEYERRLPKGTPIPPSGPSPDRPPMNKGVDANEYGRRLPKNSKNGPPGPNLLHPIMKQYVDDVDQQ